jgi:4-diphosphocytidyl-2-C-methyl-D-erythritol kinase
MISFPHAKINLGLQVIEKRHDGFHNINTCFYPIGWSDVLEIVESESMSFESTGLPIPGDPEQNLCLKAYSLLASTHQIPPVKIHLHKVIPMGAGLGGGSSDGAFTLKLLNDLFELGLTSEELETLAGQLGSDCAFFIKGQPVLASGRGNEFEVIDFKPPGKYLLVVYPPLSVSTARAYQGISPKPPTHALPQVLAAPDQWSDRLVNDFEVPVFEMHPEIESLKTLMVTMGAIYSAMSGSGSAVFGFFDTVPDTQQIPENFRYWVEELDTFEVK